MVVFINGRPVDSRAINGALMESYRGSLPEGRYPVAYAFLECAPADVDVNVHPAKREVRFRNEPQVRGFVIRAVLGRLREWSGQGPEAQAPQPVVHASHAPLPAPFQAFAADRPQDPPAASPVGPSPPGGARDAAPRWRFVGMAHGSYALFETDHGLVLLDRRAAHERIWYERLKAQFREGVTVQRLLLPVSVELNPVASALLTDSLRFLRSHGLEVEEFGRNFFRIEALPSWMEPGDAEAFLRDLVDALREGALRADDLDLARDALARLAAAKAVRLPALSGGAEVTALLGQLFSTASPVTSPSGRPTFVELNHAELARRFQK
jgi:DNA mismatch repair protein MutL